MNRDTIVMILSGIGAAILALVLALQPMKTVYAAAASTISGKVVAIEAETDALDAPSESANVVHTFAAGESAFITGEENGFKTIFWQGKTLYIKEGVTYKRGSASSGAGAESESGDADGSQVETSSEEANEDSSSEDKMEDNALENSEAATEKVPLDDGELTGEALKEALEKEFEQAAIEDVTVVESFVRQEEAKKKALIWKIVIGALVVGLLVVSVIIGLKNKNADENQENEKK